MRFFEYAHLPGNLQGVSAALGELAENMDARLPEGPEKSAGLRKLLEAKDCFVRAALTIAILLCLSLTAAAEDRAFPRGCQPSPRHKILAAPQHQPTAQPPEHVARIPAHNSMFGNDQFGDCVTAEEAFCKACDGIFLSTTVVVDWARQHGFLNGADLISVMEAMAKDGFPGTPPQVYDDGPYSTVAYADETILKSAITLGNVKIAIDANALPSGAGNQQGWFAIGGGNWPNTDHCVSICGYGSAEYLYSQLNVSVPPSLAGVSGYIVDTWGTVGFVDHPWLMAAMSGAGEAYVRNPTTVVVPPLTPPAPPTPTRLTFAEVMQLLIAKLFHHLTPSQAAAAADFFADDGSPRVNLVKSIAYHRALRAGVIPAGTSIDAVNWQELLKIIQELEPLIVPLIPLLFGDEPTAALDSPSVFAFASAQCGPKGCPLPAPSTRRAPVRPRSPSRKTIRVRSTAAGSFRFVERDSP